MPRANDVFSVQIAFAQRTALVRTDAIEAAQHAIVIAKRVLRAVEMSLRQ